MYLAHFCPKLFWRFFITQLNHFLSYRRHTVKHCIAYALYQKFETKIPINETALPRSQFPFMYIFVSNLYTPTIGPQTQYSNIGRPIVGMYKSLTDTWMQKLGTRPRSFISGYKCFEFSVQCVNKYYSTARSHYLLIDIFPMILHEYHGLRKCHYVPGTYEPQFCKDPTPVSRLVQGWSTSPRFV
jgi:hypothetical protein